MNEATVISEKTPARDALGRFLPGNKTALGNSGGRPTAAAMENLSIVLATIADNSTMQKWVASMRRKLERADPWATEFVFERLLGKVPNKQELSAADGEPLEIIIQHVEVPVPDYSHEA